MVFKSHIFGNKTVIVSDPMQICRLRTDAFSKPNMWQAVLLVLVYGLDGSIVSHPSHTAYATYCIYV